MLSGWLTTPITVASAMRAITDSGIIGLVPSSLGLCVLDIDVSKELDAQTRLELAKIAYRHTREQFPSSAFVAASQSGMPHIYYHTHGASNNMKWLYGDFICGSGQVAITNPQKIIPMLRAAAESEVSNRYFLDPSALLSKDAEPRIGALNAHMNTGISRVLRELKQKSGRRGEGEETNKTLVKAVSVMAGFHLDRDLVFSVVEAITSQWEMPYSAERLRIEFDSAYSWGQDNPLGHRPDYKIQDMQILPDSVEGFERGLQLLGIEAARDALLDTHIWKEPGGDWKPFDSPDNDFLRTLFKKNFRLPAEKVRRWQLSDSEWRQTVNGFMHTHTRNPVKSYFDGLRGSWDGKPRVFDWFCEHFKTEMPDFGTVEYEYLEFAVMALFGNLIWRVYEPGAMTRCTPILVGPPETGKSTLVRNMLPPELTGYLNPNFSFHTGSGAIVETETSLLGYVLAEFAELDGLSRAQVSQVKAFFTLDAAVARFKYNKFASRVLRRTHIIGTANLDMQLPDDEAAQMRFVVIDVEKDGEPHSSLPPVRDQLWAECLARFDRGERWNFMPKHLKRQQLKTSQEHGNVDPFLIAALKDMTPYEGFKTNGEVIAHVGYSADSMPDRVLGRLLTRLVRHLRLPLVSSRQYRNENGKKSMKSGYKYDRAMS